jgi:hypothetical protein
MTTKAIATVYATWWTYGSQAPGWYAHLAFGDRIITDSRKIDFPVAVEDYGRDDADELEAALREAYPMAEVIVER